MGRVALKEGEEEEEEKNKEEATKKTRVSEEEMKKEEALFTGLSIFYPLGKLLIAFVYFCLLFLSVTF